MRGTLSDIDHVARTWLSAMKDYTGLPLEMTAFAPFDGLQFTLSVVLGDEERVLTRTAGSHYSLLLIELPITEVWDKMLEELIPERLAELEKEYALADAWLHYIKEYDRG